jgi:hypothetical protein
MKICLQPGLEAQNLVEKHCSNLQTSYVQQWTATDKNTLTNINANIQWFGFRLKLFWLATQDASKMTLTSKLDKRDSKIIILLR